MNKTIKLRMPSYYKSFSCIADRCSDSCCIGWEIDIDSRSYNYYKSVGGNFGRILSDNISEVSVPHFILGKDQRCPFLNEKNLCEVFINLGEESLCNICRDHPRFFEWYDGIKEGGIGLCCEAAAEIVISCKDDFSYYDVTIPFEECEEYDRDFYEYLFIIRENIIAHIQNKSLSLSERLCDILCYTYDLQEKYDNFSFDIPKVKSRQHAETKANFSGIIREFSSLEMLGEKNLFKNITKKNYNIISSENFKENKEILRAFENIAVYFIWRHFLKSVYEDEFYSKAAFSVLSTAVIAALCIYNDNNLSENTMIYNAVYYSKEIEYSESNLNRIFDSFYENDAFSISNIIAFIKEIFSDFKV